MVHEPTITTPRQRRHLATRKNILATAMTLLIDDGIDGLTIGRLAAQLDYTKGALYRYFPSKDALIAALQVSSLARVHNRFEDSWAHAGRSLGPLDERANSLAMILLTTRLYGRLEAELPADFALIRLAVGDPRHLLSNQEVSAVMEQMLVLINAVAALICRAVKSGALREGDSTQRAVLLWASAHGNVLTGKFSRYNKDLFDTQRLIESLTRNLLSGWGALNEDIVAATNSIKGL